MIVVLQSKGYSSRSKRERSDGETCLQDPLLPLAQPPTESWAEKITKRNLRQRQSRRAPSLSSLAGVVSPE